MPSVEIVTDKAAWEALMQTARSHSFLQSWAWGETNEAGGNRIFRLGVRKNDALAAAALVIKVAARRGNFLLIPHGPIASRDYDEAQLTRVLLIHAEELAKKEECAFVRVCPLSPDNPTAFAFYHSLGYRAAPIHMHPEIAWMLDISKPEEQLLKEMRKTTRYLIKKLDAEGVEIEMSGNPDDIEKFWPVYEQTAKRQQFTAFSKNNLRKEFEVFAQDSGVKFFFGKHNDTIVAVAIIVFYNGQAFYHHSGSLSDAGGSNVSYLLQWRVIQEAKKRGCKLYNFWGISPEDRPKHPWAGLSQFKKGFGGFPEKYLHAQDKALSWKYQVNWLVETFRRIKRGF